MIASCGFEIKFHDWETCNCAASYNPPSDTVTPTFHDISWSSEGTLLAAVPLSGRSIILRPHLASPFRAESTLITVDAIEIASVKCARFSQTDSQTIALGTSSGHVLNYNYKTKSANVLIDDLPASVNFLEYGADDMYMVAGCTNGQIFQLQPGMGITASYFVPHSQVLTCLAVHPINTQYLAGGSEQGVIAVWDINTSCCVMKESQHEGILQDAGFSPSDDSLATIGVDSKVYIYDLRTTSCVHEKHFDARLTSMVYCPDGHDLAVATDRGYILCLDKRYLKTTRAGVKAHESAICKMRFQRPVQNSIFGGHSSTERTSQHAALNSRSEIKIGDFVSRSRMPLASSSHSKESSRIATAGEKAVPRTPPFDPSHNNAGDLSMFHIIDEAHLTRLREEVMNTTKEIVNQVLENMNVEFLKMRMSVSRDFCMVEMRNKERWQEFNETLIRLAYLEDRQLEINEPADGDAHADSATDLHAHSEANTNTFADLPYSEQTLNRENDTENDMLEIDYNCDTASGNLDSQTSKVRSANYIISQNRDRESVKRKSRFASRLPRQTSNLSSKFQHGMDDSGD